MSAANDAADRLLYDYWRSSAAFRVRIALRLKGLDYEPHAVHLLRDGGQQHADAYRVINPQGLIPALKIDGALLTQSLAIIEYLDEAYPQPPLLPGNAMQRAAIRSLSLQIACDIHPLNNLRVLNRLKAQFGADETQRTAWMQHWMQLGFAALEPRLSAMSDGRRHCVGDQITMADVVLVPQVFNARRFDLPMDVYPTICRLSDAAMELDAFQRAAPQQQPDAE